MLWFLQRIATLWSQLKGYAFLAFLIILFGAIDELEMLKKGRVLIDEMLKFFT